MRVLFIADVFGSAGRTAIAELLPGLLGRLMPDFCVANCENVAGGFGFTPATADELLRSGIDVLTGGNHSWDRRESMGYLDSNERVLRPHNYPNGNPGRGAGVFFTRKGDKVAVLNLMGRVFLDPIDCPFRAADEALPRLRAETPVVLVDMHAEATSEKLAMGRHLDGRVTAVFGTHTHVQTADERVLPGGTAYITDAGMTGPHDSIIGVKTDLILRRFRTKLPVRFEPAEGDPRLSGALVDVDAETGRALRIERIHLAAGG
ncbi:MAG: TIGR00282 family metallophosphoesterase [Candidatus Latescibacterota bacterium]|nr:MAG: TIGR00282 family metallophosphoesterase [Candidatus Latescibacterota bacterium]